MVGTGGEPKSEKHPQIRQFLREVPTNKVITDRNTHKKGRHSRNFYKNVAAAGIPLK